MVADVTETRNVIPSLKLKTCMTIKSWLFMCFLQRARKIFVAPFFLQRARKIFCSPNPKQISCRKPCLLIKISFRRFDRCAQFFRLFYNA